MPVLPGMESFEGKKVVRVLVVDDSAFMRFTITKHLGEHPEILVIGSARDGNEALEMIPKLNPDVVTLDVEMPHLDGLSTLREIMTKFPRPVIMLSSLTAEGTLETVQALTIGAVDFIAKPSNKANIQAVMDDAANKIIKAASTKVYRLSANQKVNELPSKSVVKTNKSVRSLSSSDKILFIGSSTGGPRALNSLIPELPANLAAAVVIVQHMPAGFTRSLAERLDSISKIRVKEAEPGDRLEVGKAILAPGGFHMVFDRNGQVTLNQNPPVHGVRPAIDVAMTSIVPLYGKSIVGVILTGMGNDGTTGCQLIHEAGGYVIAEDESTCVVWGMPRSVYEAGVSDEVKPLNEIAMAIQKKIMSPNR
jgi:two-component system, chemotaxis family, protein-glutamate methylesterase/glutaminase